MSFIRLLIRKVCYESDHLAPICPLLSQDAFSQLSIIRFETMHKLVRERSASSSPKRDRDNRFRRFRVCGREKTSSSDKNTKMSQTEVRPPAYQKNESKCANRQVPSINLFVPIQYGTHRRIICLYRRNRNLIVRKDLIMR